MQIFGSRELMEDVHQRDLCIGCGACVDLCPYFRNYRGKTSQLFPCTLEQGRCYAYCPKAEVDLNELTRITNGADYDGRPLGSYKTILGTRAGENMQGVEAQSGGTVTALLTFAMQTGLIDVAVLTDRQALIPIARMVTDWQDIAACATSKFTAAPTIAALNSAVREGFQSVGVVGTPCQMTAVAQMRSNPLGKPEHTVPVALTVGLFCNWSLDTRRLMSVLSEKMDTAFIRKMDIPPPPANILRIDTKNGPIKISLSEIKPLIPHTCFICMDLTAELADLAVGMYEGRQGWNTLIVRSDTGARLVDRARDAGFIEAAEIPAENKAHLSRAAAEKKERSLRTLIRRELINTENGRRAAVRIPPQIVKRILATDTH
ncbi:MAG: Coenzyme F420 hydrogenase/dehydrogenase, beta subunit C-terminal domain [Desulfobacterales bacterium]|nr:Coenzyme F420 hydrogenase/dehydrogenase, beta subunit C-terminal domain [Desulfobacterales bacterium]